MPIRQWAFDVRTVDYHTAGEPFRIVVAGVPAVGGASVADRRVAAPLSAAEPVRALLCNEPRGHADMYGCFLVPPDDGGADLGVLFWHKDGYSTACGHGTIALGAWAVDAGLVPVHDGADTEVVIDVPSGRVTARVGHDEGGARTVAFANVPSYVVSRAVAVPTGAGVVEVDVSYGGALYASLPAAAVGLAVRPECVADLIRAGRQVRAALADHPAATHPTDPRLSGIYGTIFFEDLPDTPHGPRQRNVTVFADGEVDRSPCGSGTSARLALLAADGLLPAGAVLTHESVVGTVFTGRVVAGTRAAGRPAVRTEITGSAFRTGEHRFVLDPADHLGTGFTMR